MQFFQDSVYLANCVTTKAILEISRKRRRRRREIASILKNNNNNRFRDASKIETMRATTQTISIKILAFKNKQQQQNQE